MQYDIFVSYSRRNLSAVKTIKEELEHNGFSCWMDIDGIESGEENFTRKIVPALDNCIAVLFFISADSQKSKWTAKELSYADRNGKRVVPLRFNDDALVGEFDFNYGGADIIDWRTPEQKQKLIIDLKRWTASASGGRSANAKGQFSVSPSTETCSGEHEKKNPDMLGSLGRRHAYVSNAARKIDVLASAMLSKYVHDGYDVQRLSFEHGEQRGVLVKIQNYKSNAGKYFRMVVGMWACATIKLLLRGNNLEVKVFGGKWIDKIGVVVVSLFILWPLLLVALIGAYRQKRLLDAAYDSVIQQVSSPP